MPGILKPDKKSVVWLALGAILLPAVLRRVGVNVPSL